MQRHRRQIPILGDDGQEMLSNSTVAVVGLGGLGCNVITHLASAGVGHFVIADDQLVEPTNLNRQFVYCENDIGEKKTLCSENWIRRIHPRCTVRTVDEAIDDTNVHTLGKCDIILDCLDNRAGRLAVNRYAVKNNIALVHGGAEDMNGQVFVVIPGKTACLECILPETKEKEVPSLSPIVGMIGSVQAGEAIKLLSGKHSPLIGKLLLMDASENTYRVTDVKRRDGCPCCSQTLFPDRSQLP